VYNPRQEKDKVNKVFFPRTSMLDLAIRRMSASGQKQKFYDHLQNARFRG
jgi:hypothetical protein